MKTQSKFICFALAALLFSGCSASNNKEANTKTLEEQFTIVQESMGEDFVATQPLSKEEAITRFSLETDDIDEIQASMAMISTQVDTVVIVRAKDGKAENVKQALETYRQTLVDDTMQYPMNKPVIQGSVVKQNGNDVYFIMLSVFNEDFMDFGEDEQVKQIQKQNEEVYQKLI